MPVDFSQLKTPDWSNYASDFLKSYNDGVKLHQQDTLNKELASGNLQQAQTDALKTGNFDYYDRAQTIHNDQLAQTQTKLDAIAKGAQALKGVPEEQRATVFQSSIAPMLKMKGVDDVIIQHAMAPGGLSDTALDGYISQSSLALKDIMAMNEGVVVGHDLVNKSTGKPIYKGAPELQFIPSTNPITGQTTITVGNKDTGGLGPNAFGPGPMGQVPAPAQGAPVAPAQGQATAPAPAQAPIASLPPKHAEVASVLSASLPAPVVAGFMGNFAAEGGYDGANGDGGMSHGIAQLNGPRLANFQRMFGVDPSQASPTQQAQFTLWEMQHPEAAGMTVAQRDAIMAADSPQKAAYLIDKYYERSDGSARRLRMNAAVQYANGGAPAQAATPAASAPQVASAPSNDTPGVYNVFGPAPQGHWGKDPQGNDTWYNPKGEPTKTAKTATPKLPQEALDNATDTSILTGKMPMLGNGGAQVKTQIMANTPARLHALGISNADISTIQSQHSDDLKNLTARRQQQSTMQSSYNGVQLHGQQLIKYLQQLPGNASASTINKVVNTYSDYMNDPNYKKYLGVLPNFQGEIARIITAGPSGNGGHLSDESQKKLDMLRDPNVSRDNKIAIIQAALKQAKAKEVGNNQDIAEIRQRLDGGLPAYVRYIKGTSQQSAPAPQHGQGNLPRLSPEQARSLPPGTHFIGLDGVERVRH